MELKHTPGPWSLDDQHSPLVFGSDGTYLARVLSYSDGTTGTLRDSADADGRLIIAAPDMLEMLIEAATEGLGGQHFDVWELMAPPEHVGHMRRVLKLIAKARGKSTFGNDWMEALS
jgi:hypothetical protein